MPAGKGAVATASALSAERSNAWRSQSVSAFSSSASSSRSTTSVCCDTGRARQPFPNRFPAARTTAVWSPRILDRFVVSKLMRVLSGKPRRLGSFRKSRELCESSFKYSLSSSSPFKRRNPSRGGATSRFTRSDRMRKRWKTGMAFMALGSAGMSVHLPTGGLRKGR